MFLWIVVIVCNAVTFKSNIISIDSTLQVGETIDMLVPKSLVNKMSPMWNSIFEITLKNAGMHVNHLFFFFHRKSQFWTFNENVQNWFADVQNVQNVQNDVQMCRMCKWCAECENDVHDVHMTTQQRDQELVLRYAEWFHLVKLYCFS